MLEKSIGFVAHRFGMRTGGALFAVVLEVDRKSGPIVGHLDLMECLCLTKMSCKGVVMGVLENMESESAGVWNIDTSEVA